MQVLHAFYHKNSTFESKLSTVAIDTIIVRYILFVGLFPSGTDRGVNTKIQPRTFYECSPHATGHLRLISSAAKTIPLREKGATENK
jgi:hypothetical protein